MKKTRRMKREDAIDEALDAGDECFKKLLKKKKKSASEKLVAITKKTQMQIQIIHEELIQSEPRGLPQVG